MTQAQAKSKAQGAQTPLRWSQLFLAMVTGFALMWVVQTLQPMVGGWSFPEWYRQIAFEHPRLALYLFDSLKYLATILVPCVLVGMFIGWRWAPYALPIAFIATMPLFMSESIMPFLADQYHRAWVSAYPFLAVTRSLLSLCLLPLTAWLMSRRRRQSNG